MKLRYLLAVTAAVAISFLTPSLSLAKSRKSKPPETHETTITSVTPTSITISEDKNTRTFNISQFTEVTINGSKATAADLKPGMLVSVTMADSTRLSRITATTK